MRTGHAAHGLEPAHLNKFIISNWAHARPPASTQLGAWLGKRRLFEHIRYAVKTGRYRYLYSCAPPRALSLSSTWGLLALLSTIYSYPGTRV